VEELTSCDHDKGYTGHEESELFVWNARKEKQIEDSVVSGIRDFTTHFLIVDVCEHRDERWNAQ